MNRNMKARLLASGLALIAFFASGNLLAQVSSWGHPGHAYATSGFFAGTDSDKLAYRFTEQGNRSINGVWININVVAGTPPVYRIGIQGDAAGNPDGSFIQYTDYTNTEGTG